MGHGRDVMTLGDRLHSIRWRMSQSRWEDRAYSLRRGRWTGLREGLGEREKYRPEELILIFDGTDESDGNLCRHWERRSRLGRASPFSRGRGLSLVPRLNRPSTTHPHLLHVSKGRGITRGLQLRRLSPSKAVRPVQRWKIRHRQEARVRSPSSLPHSRPAPISTVGVTSLPYGSSRTLCTYSSLSTAMFLILCSQREASFRFEDRKVGWEILRDRSR